MAGLTLSRKVGEKIVIDGDIELVVTEVRGNRVKLTFVSPRHRKIVRQELMPFSEKGEVSGSRSVPVPAVAGG
jgi:carbon storage regulator CsrA